MTAEFSFREKVYQMFVLAPFGQDFSTSPALKIALENGLGGVIFFSRNIQSFEQTKTFTSEISACSKIPPFISVDEEGGRVERTENLFGGKKFLSAKYQAQKGLEFVREETSRIALLLKELGFNMNFAPVLDVNTNPKNPIIGERAYSNNADDVIKFGICAVKTYMENGIIPVGKHFPGHGDAGEDSHLTLPVLNMRLHEAETFHIKPFKAAIDAGIPAIMAAHLYCPYFGKEVVPASLSPAALGYLRQKLGFNGLIISDDMEMNGVKMFEPFEAVLRGIDAGINLFLFRDCSEKTISVIEKVYACAQENIQLKHLIEAAFERICAIKNKFIR